MEGKEDLMNQFTEERECEYKGRRYLVRDNGAVYRLCKSEGKPSKWDEFWTFGKKDERSGYLFISEERVHRIVCSAFHGEPEGDRNIVDHIDTNRCNNRPENLRWVTKLENILLNPITRAKVELICGSVEAFLGNPSLLYGHETENPNFEYMRTVSKEEGRRTLKRWLEWTEKPLDERRPKGIGLGEGIYQDNKTYIQFNKNKKSYPEQRELDKKKERINYPDWYGIKDSLTLGAKQLDWRPKTEFLLCPLEGQERTIKSYLNNLVKGKPFSRSQYKGGDAVYKCEYNTSNESLYVVTLNQSILDFGHGKPWQLWKITLEDNCFIHKQIDRYSAPKGADRDIITDKGERWTGGEVWDDLF